MKRNNRKPSGVYLVIDPAMDHADLIERLSKALEGGISLLQIWNHWPAGYSIVDKQKLVHELVELASFYSVPVLINEEASLLKGTRLSGVHYDHRPSEQELAAVRTAYGEDLILGLTCTNNLDRIEWAERNGFSYISFCSMFPSASVNQCDIVRPESVREARRLTDMSLFISGGLTIESLQKLPELEVDGLAVISGIMNSDNPKTAVAEYRRGLEQLTLSNKREQL